MNWQAVLLSLKLGAITVLLLGVIAVPLAYWISFSRWRFRFLVDAFVALPLVLPPTVLGFYVLLAIGPRSPLGQAFEAFFGRGLPFTFEGLVVGSILYSLPFAVQPLAASFSSVDRRMLEASWTLGASKLRTFRRVILPQSRKGLLVAAVLTFAHTIGEFGVVLMVGGNIEGVTRTISIDIYENVQLLDYRSAAITSVVLLVFSFSVLACLYLVTHRIWLQWPTGRQ